MAALVERERDTHTQMLTSSITAFGETLATSNENLLIRIADKINDISRSPTPKRIEDTMVAVVMGIQHIQLILEEMGPDGRRPS